MFNTNCDESNNYKIKGTGNDIYGKQRLELAVYLKNNILPYINNKWFIENGTLLGAYRNNKFIEMLFFENINNIETINFNKLYDFSE